MALLAAAEAVRQPLFAELRCDVGQRRARCLPRVCRAFEAVWGLEAGAPMLASFDLAASVPSPANAITVSVTAARPVELPGAAGAVTVRLADTSGSPVAGEGMSGCSSSLASVSR